MRHFWKLFVIFRNKWHRTRRATVGGLNCLDWDSKRWTEFADVVASDVTYIHPLKTAASSRIYTLNTICRTDAEGAQPRNSALVLHACSDSCRFDRGMFRIMKQTCLIQYRYSSNQALLEL